MWKCSRRGWRLPLQEEIGICSGGIKVPGTGLHLLDVS